MFRWFVGLFIVAFLFLHINVGFRASADNPQGINPVLTDMPNPTAKISPFFIDLESVHKIVCRLNSKYDSVGTGEVIDTNTVVTAHHVVGHNTHCYIGGHRANVIYDNPMLDFAVLDYPTGKEPRFPYSCSGALTGHTYFAIGHANGTSLAVTKLTALPDYEDSHDADDGQPFLHVRRFRGTAYHGQSGGPVVDENGVEVGTIIAGGEDEQGDQADVREIRDTYLCQDIAQNYHQGGKPRPVH